MLIKTLLSDCPVTLLPSRKPHGFWVTLLRLLSTENTQGWNKSRQPPKPTCKGIRGHNVRTRRKVLECLYKVNFFFCLKLGVRHLHKSPRLQALSLEMSKTSVQDKNLEGVVSMSATLGMASPQLPARNTKESTPLPSTKRLIRTRLFSLK